jgi:hypothetical protein
MSVVICDHGGETECDKREKLSLCQIAWVLNKAKLEAISTKNPPVTTDNIEAKQTR